MEYVPSDVKQRLQDSGRLEQAGEVLDFISQTLGAYRTSELSPTQHFLVYAPCQGSKSDIHAVSLLGAYAAGVTAASISKGKQCAEELTYTKLRAKCPEHLFTVEVFKSSKHCANSVVTRKGVSWMLFAGEAQFRHFLDGLSQLQACRPTPKGVCGWLLVLDESDAYQEAGPLSPRVLEYERALRAVLGREAYRKEDSVPLLVTPPAVVIHVTATPVPVLLSMVNHGMDLKPGRLMSLRDTPDYIGVDNYRWLCEPGTDTPVHLDDGDLNTGNSFADHWKINLWLDDLDSVPNGLGLYIANSRVNNLRSEEKVKTCRDTVTKLREHVLNRNPNSHMVFAATASNDCWFVGGGMSDFQHVALTKDFPVELLLEKLITLAGSGSMLVQMHAKAKRCITWHTRQRVVSHLVNALGAGVNLADYAQGNGRGCASGGRELLRKTGRDYVTWLGQRWDLKSDQNMHAFVREIARRNQTRPLTQIINEVYPFECNFQLANASRFHSEKRKTEDRCWERSKKPSWRVTLPGPDPLQLEAEQYALSTRPETRRVMTFADLPSTPGETAMLTDQEVCSAFQRPGVVLVTQLKVHTCDGLGIQYSFDALKTDTAAAGSRGIIGRAVEAQYGAKLLLAYNYNLAKCRTEPGRISNASQSGYWRLCEENGVACIVVITYCQPSTENIVVSEDILVPEGAVPAWHLFDGIDHSRERLSDKSLTFQTPKIRIAISNKR